MDSVQGPLQFGIRLLFTATYTIHVLLYAIMQFSHVHDLLTEDTLKCVVDGKTYEELAMVPSNSSDPCEVCHCCVSHQIIMYVIPVLIVIECIQIGELVCNTIFQSCPQLNCDINQIVVEEGKCCPRCADGMCRSP